MVRESFDGELSLEELLKRALKLLSK